MSKNKLSSLVSIIFILILAGVYVFAQTSGVSHFPSEITCTTDLCIKGGKIGIGTTNPGVKLDVVVPSGQNPIAKLISQDTSVNRWVQIGTGSAYMNLGIASADSTKNFAYIWSSSGNFMIGNDGNPAFVVSGMAGGSVGVAGSVSGAIFYDNPNASYYVDPDGITKLNFVSIIGHQGEDKRLDLIGSNSCCGYNHIESYGKPLALNWGTGQPIYMGDGNPITVKTRGNFFVESANINVGSMGFGGHPARGTTNFDAWIDPGEEQDFVFTYAGCADEAACQNEDFIFNFNPHGTNYHTLTINMVSGNMWLKGGLNADFVVQRSSVDYKKNLERYNGSFLKRVKNIQPYLYNFKKEGKTSKKHFGYLAEDLPKEVLSESGKEIDLNAYSAMLLKLIQEQQEEIDTLKKEIEKLKK